MHLFLSIIYEISTFIAKVQIVDKTNKRVKYDDSCTWGTYVFSCGVWFALICKKKCWFFIFNFWTFGAVLYSSFFQFLLNKNPNFRDFFSLLFEKVFYSNKSSNIDFSVLKMKKWNFEKHYSLSRQLQKLICVICDLQDVHSQLKVVIFVYCASRIIPTLLSCQEGGSSVFNLAGRNYPILKTLLQLQPLNIFLKICYWFFKN